VQNLWTYILVYMVISLINLVLSCQSVIAVNITIVVCDQELRPLISDIEQSILALISTYYSLPSSHGHTLRKSVADSVVSLANSMQCLLRALDTKSESQR